MPTYGYSCDDCGHEFEEFQSISAKPLKKCPECSGKVTRLIGGGSGVLFKGSGFYETDYRSKNYKESAKKDNKSNQPAKVKSKDAKSKKTNSKDK